MVTDYNLLYIMLTSLRNMVDNVLTGSGMNGKKCVAFKKYAAPTVKNSLPQHVKPSASVNNFKCNLKTYLFKEAYELYNSL